MRALVVCPTYGRLPYLGRFLSSFTQQTYDDKHLVIINDDKNVELVCERKDVTILNCNQRMKIAEKRNLGAIYGTHDIIMPWDDDDIFLPKRIENHIKKFEDPDVDVYRNMQAYYITNSIFQVSIGTFNSISYRRKEWFRVSGYQFQGGSGEDQEFYRKLSNFLKEDLPDERDFVYNWSGLNYHLSPDPTPAQTEKIAYTQLQDMNLVGKKFRINPDFEEYNNYLWLDKLYKERQENLPVKHVSFGKIDISHLL